MVVIAEHLVALLGVQQVDEPQGNEFFVEVAVTEVAAHDAPPVAERVGVGRGGGNRLWRSGCHIDQYSTRDADVPRPLWTARLSDCPFNLWALPEAPGTPGVDSSRR